MGLISNKNEILKMSTLGSKLWTDITIAIRVVAAAFVINEYVGTCTLCVGPSMIPTLCKQTSQDSSSKADTAKLKSSNKNLAKTDSSASVSGSWMGGDLVVIDRFSYNWSGFKSIQRGDVVVATSTYNPRIGICKRVVALPGDMVVQEAKVAGVMTTKEVYVPKGHVWVEGDNKTNSTDSRNYGPVPIGLIYGRVVFKLYPFNEIGLIGRTVKEG